MMHASASIYRHHIDLFSRRPFESLANLASPSQLWCLYLIRNDRDDGGKPGISGLMLTVTDTDGLPGEPRTTTERPWCL